MGNQKKILLEHHLKTLLVDVFTQKKCANPKLVVALSGGLDSCVLLHLLMSCQQTLPFQLQAHHVHHGLSPNADAWADFCRNFCAKLAVPLTISSIKLNKNSGLGLEAAARDARYKALRRTQADFILLAHHQDDQAETLLLQLARGAGVKGLAGMATMNGKLLRPLLNVPRKTLAQYAQQHQLTWIEDESNADIKFDRNFMRHKVLPLLAKQYPSIQQTISRSAQHMAQASALLDELAVLDATNCAYIAGSKQLQLQTLAQLSNSRVNNVLRWWLIEQGFNAPSAAQLQQMTQQLLHAKIDAAIKIKLNANTLLRRYQGNAYLVDATSNIDTNFKCVWHGENTLTLPDQSRLQFGKLLGEGISIKFTDFAPLTIQYRQNSATIKPQANRPRRSLKALLQAFNIPPWQRERLPLIFLDKQLAAVPNIAVDVTLKAKSDELGLVITWQSN